MRMIVLSLLLLSATTSVTAEESRRLEPAQVKDPLSYTECQRYVSELDKPEMRAKTIVFPGHELVETIVDKGINCSIGGTEYYYFNERLIKIVNQEMYLLYLK